MNNTSQLNNVQVTYESIARPPFSIDINRIYTVKVNNNNIYIVDGNKEIKITEDVLMKYFIPIKEKNWNKITQNKFNKVPNGKIEEVIDEVANETTQNIKNNLKK